MKTEPGKALAVRNEALTARMDKSIAAGMWDGGPFSTDPETRDRFAANVKREVLIQVARRTELWQCTLTSLADAARDAFYTGLLPDGREGYVVPFRVNVGTKAKPSWETRAAFIPSWRGVQSVACEDHDFDGIKAEVYRDGDEFEWTEGLTPTLRHVPKLNGEGQILAAYAVAWRPGRDPVFVVVDRHDLNAARRASKGAGWKINEVAMSRKTAVRRLCDRVITRPTARLAAVLRSGPPPGAVTAGDDEQSALAARVEQAKISPPSTEPETEPAPVVEAEVIETDEPVDEPEPEPNPEPEEPAPAPAPGAPPPYKAPGMTDAEIDDLRKRHSLFSDG